jgi:hypothetical protein
LDNLQPQNALSLRGCVAILIFRFNDPDAAIACLQKSGITFLAAEELLAEEHLKD